ncbi:MAG: PP2C family protein-serine/threonine phosphatase, partial [Acidobacteriota bacterium]|nr:PP2C family protein-serine/threonine phosphatase [Acidobacteriota bacterium]
DYLLKPVGRRRLARAIDRVRESMTPGGRLEREAADATGAQARLFPRTLPPMVHLEYSGMCRAAREVGGDYYDFLPISESRLGIAVGDVSGKGIFAGILMSNLQARLQSIAAARKGAPSDVVNETNRVMHTVTESNRYVTLFYALFDDTTLDLRYVNAAQNPPILLRGDETLRLPSNGMAVGLMADTRYAESSVRLRPGDVLVAYTDGLTEMRDPEDEEFGDRRVVELASRHRDRPASELRDLLVERVDRFREGMGQNDDMTVVVAKVR